MMKKMTKAALLAAALAFTAGLAGCFVSAVEDDGAGNGSTAQGGGNGTTYTLDASVAKVPEDYSATTDISLTAGGLSFTFNSSKAGTDSSYNHNNRYNMGGKMATNQNYIGFTTTGGGSVVVHFYNNGSSGGGRHAVFAKGSPKNAASADETGKEETVNSSNTDVTTTFKFDTAGTYYVGGDNGIYITKLEVTF